MLKQKKVKSPIIRYQFIDLFSALLKAQLVLFAKLDFTCYLEQSDQEKNVK